MIPSGMFRTVRESSAPSIAASWLTDANHVRDAIARFPQVDGVDDAERAQAFGNIKAAAQYYGIAFHAKDWHEINVSLCGRAGFIV